MIDKNKILDEISHTKNGSVLREKNFKKKYPDAYTEMNKYVYPDIFLFIQKLYHWIHNDCNFNKGICPECGGRCGFKSFAEGYSKYCCIKCAANSESISNKKKKTNIKRYGAENPFGSPKIQKKIKKTNLKKYGCEYCSQSKEVKNKIKHTVFERYGVNNAAKSKEIQDKIKKTNLERYGTENPQQCETVKCKTRKTNLKKYGVEYVFQSEVVKEKINDTLYKNYNVSHPSRSKEIQEKRRQKTLEKYGVDNTSKLPEIKDKIKKTNLEKYGCEYSLQSKTIRDKAKKTNLKRYGSENPFGSPEIQERIKKTNLERYGTEYVRKSIAEEEMFKYISEIYSGTVVHDDRHTLNGKEIDVFLPDLKIGFEFNGDYWHMNPKIYEKDIYNESVKRFAYEIWERDYNKICMAKEKGIMVYTIWESEWRNNNIKTKKYIKNIIDSKLM